MLIFKNNEEVQKMILDAKHMAASLALDNRNDPNSIEQRLLTLINTYAFLCCLAYKNMTWKEIKEKLQNPDFDEAFEITVKSFNLEIEQMVKEELTKNTINNIPV